jgi:hypothetical protein
MFTYRWTHRFAIAPLEAVLDAVEAYFTTLPAGRYELVKRERFCLALRRGAWRRGLFDPDKHVPKFLGIDRREVPTWPVELTVTTRPAPSEFDVIVEREVRLPNGLPLRPAHRDAGTNHFDAETAGLVEYLTEFLKLREQPAVRTEEA